MLVKQTTKHDDEIRQTDDCQASLSFTNYTVPLADDWRHIDEYKSISLRCRPH